MRTEEHSHLYIMSMFWAAKEIYLENQPPYEPPPEEPNWFAEGKADAAFNLKPKYPWHTQYWEGYSAGLREKYLSEGDAKCKAR